MRETYGRGSFEASRSPPGRQPIEVLKRISKNKFGDALYVRASAGFTRAKILYLKGRRDDALRVFLAGRELCDSATEKDLAGNSNVGVGIVKVRDFVARTRSNCEHYISILTGGKGVDAYKVDRSGLIDLALPEDMKHLDATKTEGHLNTMGIVFKSGRAEAAA